MKTFLKLFFFLFFMGILLLPALLFIDTYPQVIQKIPLSPDNIQQVKKIIQVHRLDGITKSQNKILILSATDLTLLLEYGLSKGAGIHSLASQVRLSPGFLAGTFTLKIPQSPLGKYINLSVTGRESNGILTLYAVKIGKISIPESIASPLLAVIHKLLMRVEPYSDLYQTRQAIKQVTIDDDALKIWYEWDPATTKSLKAQIRKDFIPSDHQARLVCYHNELARLSHLVQGRNISLVDLLRPMFAFAQSDTRHPPVQANKALFQVLALYVSGKELADIIDPGNPNKMATIKPIKILLSNREDLGKHFLISAALTVSTSERLANLIGLAKELDDAKGGSGFSFADLTADKAGVKMGEVAIASPSQARQLQQNMGRVLLEETFMPKIDQLPEGIMALEFKTKYQDMDSAAFKRIDSEIGHRLKNCLLYQN